MPQKPRQTREEHKGSQWVSLQALETMYPRYNPVSIGTSIWIATSHNEGEQGLIEFCCITNAIKHVVPYPRAYKPIWPSLYVYNKDTLILVDGRRGLLNTFNVATTQFGGTISIPRMGADCSVIAVKEYIHIMHGRDNINSQYVIVSMTNQTVRTFENYHGSQAMSYAAITKLNDSSFYKFGGFDQNTNKRVDSFFIGSLPKHNPQNPIAWKLAPHYKLRQPLEGFGYVHYGPLIIIFGGQGDGHRDLDDIHILDVRQKKGWTQSKLKCPSRNQFIGVINQRENVHLFSFFNDHKSHFRIALKHVIPKWISKWKRSSNLISKVISKPSVQLVHRPDREPLANDQKDSEIKSKWNTKKCSKSNQCIDAVDSNSKQLYDQIRILQEKLTASFDVIARLQASNQWLESEVKLYCDEHNEAQKRIADLEQQILAMKRAQTQDPSKFMEWDQDMILSWICSVENGRFKKYLDTLQKALEESELEGDDLLYVNQQDIAEWGIKNFKDKKCLIGHIEKLINQSKDTDSSTKGEDAQNEGTQPKLNEVVQE